MNLLEEADAGSLAPLEHQLRSPELRPSDLINPSDSEESIKTIVNKVADLRSSLIESKLKEGIVPTNQSGGRLLLYTPSETVSDGASRHSSNGFFDWNDCPPWDIWLQYSDRTLMSWVPEVLFPLAQAGIDVNPVECVKWAD